MATATKKQEVKKEEPKTINVVDITTTIDSLEKQLVDAQATLHGIHGALQLAHQQKLLLDNGTA